MVLFKTFGIFLAILAVGSCKQFYSAILTDVGAIDNFNFYRNVSCQVFGIQRNLTYSNTKDEVYWDFYRTNFSYPGYFKVNSNKLEFTVRKLNSSFANEPVDAFFSLAQNASKNASESISQIRLDFIISRENVTIVKTINQTSTKFTENLNQTILPLWQKQNFTFEFYNYNVYAYLNDDYVFNVTLPVPANNFSMLIMNGSNGFLSNEYWIKSIEKQRNEMHVDRLNAVCTNVTSWDHNHNETNKNLTDTQFTTLIKSQYDLRKLMSADLYQFRNTSSSEYTKEYLKELLEDVKANYQLSRKLNEIIYTTFDLTKNEVNLKSTYMRDEVFARLRTFYFKLVELIDLELSRFN